MLLDLEDALLAGAYGSAPEKAGRDFVLYRGLISGEALTIKRASNSNDLTAAMQIVNRLYGWRGYGHGHELKEHPSRSTFIASLGNDPLGTITLTVDSSEKLGVDVSFPDHVENLRNEPGASLCELTKFAFDPSPRSRPLLAILFHAIFTYGTLRHDCTDLLIEVNPRHVRFYEASLGFERVGALMTNATVNAPSQLMRLRVAEIDKAISAQGGCHSDKGHSLYRHFLGEQEACKMKRRIASAAGIEGVCTRPSSRREKLRWPFDRLHPAIAASARPSALAQSSATAR